MVLPEGFFAELSFNVFAIYLLSFFYGVRYSGAECGCGVKPLFHSSQKPARKLAASAFKYCDWMKVLAESLRVDFCDE